MTALASGLLSCSALNPSFVELFAPEGGVAQSSLENAPGHVPIVFVNNTDFNPDLVAYMRDQGVDVDNDPNFRPRVRFIALVTFTNGTVLPIEFVDGSSQSFQTSVDTGAGPQFIGALPPDLTQVPKTNAVVVCDVASVAIPDPIQVYVPVFLKQVRIAINVGNGATQTVLDQVTQPQFRPLVPDVIDMDGAVVRFRNFDVRDVPAPATDLTCGSVVALTMTGTLRVPFISDENGVQNPGVFNTDLRRQDAVPGRFEFRVEVR